MILNLLLIGLFASLNPQQTHIADQTQGLFSLEGAVIQGGLIKGIVKPGTQVYLDDQQVQVSDDGQFIIGFGRDEAQPKTLKFITDQGDTQTEIIEIQKRDYQIQHIDGLPPAQVTPPKEVLERIRDDARRVSAARNRADARSDFFNGFIWPAKGPISGVYGSQRVLNGKPSRPHYGVDVAADTGSPVIAPADGLITLADPDLYYSGGTIILDHGHGLSSTFLHLSQIDVEVGEVIKRGDPIGKIGATGRATGPHLDWRMNWGKVRIDPEALLKVLTVKATEE